MSAKKLGSGAGVALLVVVCGLLVGRAYAVCCDIDCAVSRVFWINDGGWKCWEFDEPQAANAYHFGFAPGGDPVSRNQGNVAYWEVDSCFPCDATSGDSPQEATDPVDKIGPTYYMVWRECQ